MPSNKALNRIYLIGTSPRIPWPKDSSLKWPDDLLCRTPHDLIDLLSCRPKDANRIYEYVKQHQDVVHEFLVAKGIKEEFIDYSLSRTAFVKKLRQASCRPRINNTECGSNDMSAVGRLVRLRFDNVACYDFDELRQYLEKEGNNPKYRSLIAGNVNNIRLFLEDVGKKSLASMFPDDLEGMSDSDIVNSILRCFGLRGADNTEYEYRNYIDITHPPVIVSLKDGQVSVRFTYIVKSVINDFLPCRIIDTRSNRLLARRTIRLLQPGEASFVCSFPHDPSELSFETRLGLSERIIVDINGPIEENKSIKFYVQTEIESLFVSNDVESEKSGYCYCAFDNQRRVFRRTQHENGIYKSVSSFNMKSAVALAKSHEGEVFWIDAQGRALDKYFIFNKVYPFKEDGLSVAILPGCLAIVNSHGAFRKCVGFNQIKLNHNNGVFIVQNENNKWGLYDYSNHNMIVPCKYRDIIFYNEGIFSYKMWTQCYYFKRVSDSKEGRGGYNIIKGFQDGYGIFDGLKSNPSWGFVNHDLDECPVFFYGVGLFSQGWAPVKNSNAWGFINKESLDGDIPIDQGIFVFEEARSFKENYAAVKRLGQWGFVHINDVEALFHGRIQTDFGIPCVFDDVTDFTNGFAAVSIKGKWGFIDTAGKLVVQPEYDDGYSVIITDKDQRPEPFFTARKNKKWSIFYLNGQEVPGIPVEYEEIRQFEHGLAPAKLNGKWGYITPDGYPIEVKEDLSASTKSSDTIKKKSSANDESNSSESDYGSWTNDGWDPNFDDWTYP